MTEKSRVKFNPRTEEIEIEGSETFVKAYFEKLRQLLSNQRAARGGSSAEMGSQRRTVGKGTPGKAVKPKTAARTVKERKPVKRGKRGAIFNAVLGLIQASEGITTGQLKEETGLSERQIWTVIYKAEKAGKIRREKRGLYFGA